MVERRDVATLHPIITRCIHPGTDVHTDDWAAYRNMNQRINNVNVHRAVVHRYHFVDHVTGVHTQEMPGIVLEQPQTGTKNAPRNNKGRPTVLFRQANVTSMERGATSADRAELLSHPTNTIRRHYSGVVIPLINDE